MFSTHVSVCRLLILNFLLLYQLTSVVTLLALWLIPPSTLIYREPQSRLLTVALSVQYTEKPHISYSHPSGPRGPQSVKCLSLLGNILIFFLLLRIILFLILEVSRLAWDPGLLKLCFCHVLTLQDWVAARSFILVKNIHINKQKHLHQSINAKYRPIRVTIRSLINYISCLGDSWSLITCAPCDWIQSSKYFSQS